MTNTKARLVLPEGRIMERFSDTGFEMVQLRDALTEIAGSKSLTATPAQFYRHLQNIAAEALTAHAQRELTAGTPMIAASPSLPEQSACSTLCHPAEPCMLTEDGKCDAEEGE